MSSHGVQETDAEFDARYEAFFNRPDIDGWEIRKAMGDLAGMDLVPEPTIVCAGKITSNTQTSVNTKPSMYNLFVPTEYSLTLNKFIGLMVLFGPFIFKIVKFKERTSNNFECFIQL